ncbi:MAG: cation:proton antiporter [FCB group bacterium]|nr:cation:proton antiporter [FCB group bacterium]
MTILLMVGIAVLSGLAVGKLSERVSIPMVVGYIIAGVIVGDSGLKLVNAASASIVANIALGFIGFGIGTQLRYSTLKRMGKSIISIAILEASFAFILVAVGISILTGKIYLGLVFGALASATAPAATVDVLEEYRSRGPLTTSLLAVVGIDDGIALLLFGFGISIAQIMLSGEGSILSGLLHPLLDICGSAVLGIIIGFLYIRLIRLMKTPAEYLVLSVGVVLLSAGVAQSLKISLILTNMIVGVTACNIAPMLMQRIQNAIQGFSPPIYVLFFVLVGARLDVSILPQMGMMGFLYLVLRMAGKFGGAYLGARVSGAPDVVRKYLGFGLFSQAGVAVGLSLAAADILTTPETKHLGDMVISVIAATTFIVQIIGPPCTRYAIVKAGEADPEKLKRKNSGKKSTRDDR